MNYQALVERFYHDKAGRPPHTLDAWQYFAEEVAELNAALSSGTTTRGHLAKELGDVQYTLYGLAIALGIDLDAAFLRVHGSNMTKAVTLDGKVKKGDAYVPPDMSGALR